MGDESTDESEQTAEYDGGSIEIDAGAYRVQVWGDPDDSLDDLRDLAFEAADRAKADVQELDDRMDNGDDIHYS
jgi:hypothetical protein